MTVKTAPFEPGHRFVKYDIRGLLGTGGHAHVYDAYDPFLDREVAVKVIAAPRDAQENLAKRAQSEARVLVRIDHPNVVKVYDAGATEDGLVYLVMEKLAGRTLRAVYRDVGRLSVVEALEIARQICAGVDAAHRQGVIHRDLKPENVFIQHDNRVKVLDFGISKVMGYGAHDTTQRHVLHGTVLYMSPEHLQGYGVTNKSDVYALGTLLFEGLYAHPTLLWPEARHAKDLREVIRVQLTETPPMLHELDPSIFRHVARFVQRAILKAAEQRYASMAEMLEAADAAWQRLEREQGADYLVQWRRDLSRACKTPRNQQPQRDTVQEAMRFSTAIEPSTLARPSTQPGGLTSPPPLTSTVPFDAEQRLAHQTTTPIPPAPSSSDAPQAGAIATGGVPSRVQSSDPISRAGLSGPAVALTPAQSATLALAEQVTRTRDITASGQTAVSSPAVELGTVAPVSHPSMSKKAPADFAPASTPRFGRLSVRAVVAVGATLGLALGVGYGVLGMRSPPDPGEAPMAETGARSLLPRDVVPAAKPPTPSLRSQSVPDTELGEGVAPRKKAVAAGPSPAPNSAEGADSTLSPVSKGSITNSEAHSPSAGEKTAAASSPPATVPVSATKSVKKPREEAKQDDKPGSWLKPEMIHFPDDSPAPVAPPKAPARARMPASGLD